MFLSRKRYGKQLKLSLLYMVVALFLVLIVSYVVRSTFGDVKDVKNVKFVKNDSSLPDEPLVLPTTLPGQIIVVIVDEHQDVIPWWYKAVDDGHLRTQKNTLIHIDGHSDLASPDDIKTLMKFRHKRNSRPSAFDQLMKKNDNFIVSAIAEGLIDEVIWISPSWYNDSSMISTQTSVGSVVGTNTVKTSDGEKTYDVKASLDGQKHDGKKCRCDRFELSSNKWSSPECFIEDREELNAIVISKTLCRTFLDFKFIYSSEDLVHKKIKVKDLNLRSAILDIDEDYFGVESGVENFIEKGVSEDIQVNFDAYLRKLYCPKMIKAEHILNDRLKEFLSYLVSVKKDADRYLLESKLRESTGLFFCPSPPIETGGKTIENLYNKFVVDLYDAVDNDVAEDVQKVSVLSTELHNIYCPVRITDRIMYQNLTKVLITEFSSSKTGGERKKMKEERRELAEKFLASTKKMICKEVSIKHFIDYLIRLNLNDIEALSKMRFCLDNNPRVNEGLFSSRYGLCHGYIFPGDPLNTIYVGSNEEIKRRGKRLTNVISHLMMYAKLKFVTIARSLRDGYTPRDQQRLIERTVIESLRNASKHHGKTIRVVYDEQQLFGPEGWSLE